MPYLSLSRVARPSIVGGILLSAIMALPGQSSAQAYRDAVVFAGGIARLPDALSRQCGTATNGGGAAAGPDAAAGLFIRQHRWMIILDTRVAASPFHGGCGLVRSTTRVQVAVPVDTSFSHKAGSFATSTLRLGVETPPGLPLVRFTAGPGVVWGAQLLPLAVVTAGWSTRGQGNRFFADFERAETRLRATEVLNNSSIRLLSGQRPTQSIVLRPVVYSVRVGLEIPLR